jgi:hypothetical protein
MGELQGFGMADWQLLVADGLAEDSLGPRRPRGFRLYVLDDDNIATNLAVCALFYGGCGTGPCFGLVCRICSRPVLSAGTALFRGDGDA